MWFKFVATSAALLLVCATASAADAGRKYLDLPAGPAGSAPPPPLSMAVMSKGMLYVSGQLGLDPQTHKVPDAADAEARAVMDAVKQTLEKAGLKMDDLVTVTVYCTDLSLYDAFNAVYRTYFHGHYPARAFIGVAGLVRGAHFEVAGIAEGPGGSK